MRDEAETIMRKLDNDAISDKEYRARRHFIIEHSPAAMFLDG